MELDCSVSNFESTSLAEIPCNIEIPHYDSPLRRLESQTNLHEL